MLHRVGYLYEKGSVGIISRRPAWQKANVKGIIDSVKRSMQVDGGTAPYYWFILNCNPRDRIFSRPQAGEWFRIWLAGNRKHAVHRKSTALNQIPSLYCVVFLNLYDVNKNQVVPRDICSPRHSDDDARTSMSLCCGQLPQLWLPFLYSLMDPANL